MGSRWTLPAALPIRPADFSAAVRSTLHRPRHRWSLPLVPLRAKARRPCLQLAAAATSKSNSQQDSTPCVPGCGEAGLAARLRSAQWTKIWHALSFRGYWVSLRYWISPSSITSLCEALRLLQSFGTRGRGRSQYLVPAYEVAIVDNAASAPAPIGTVTLPLSAMEAHRRGSESAFQRAIGGKIATGRRSSAIRAIQARTPASLTAIGPSTHNGRGRAGPRASRSSQRAPAASAATFSLWIHRCWSTSASGAELDLFQGRASASPRAWAMHVLLARRNRRRLRFP